MKKLILCFAFVSLLLLTLQPLFGLVDFTVVDTWDLNLRNTSTLIPIGGNRFASTDLHSVDVYEFSSTSLEKVQSFYSAEMTSFWYDKCLDGDRLFVSTQFAGVMVFQVLANQGLVPIGNIALQPGLGGEDCSYFIWASGNIMVTSMM